MDTKNILSKLKPIIIVLLLFSLVFFLRAEASGISGVPDQMKAYFQEDNGLPYFSEMDSYYNYRLTENFVEHGYLGDTIKNGTDWDLHSYFPPGRSAEYPPLLIWITAFFYYLANLFGDYSLLQVSFWTSAIIASLCVIPAYFFVKSLSNDYGGITAGVLVGVSTFYFSHTFAGFFDTDMFGMILPLLVIWFFSVSITATESRKKMLFAVYAAISMLLFAIAWSGWWYIFYLVIFVTVLYMLISKYLFKMETFKSWKGYSSKKQWLLEQPILLPLLIFVGLSSVLMFIFWGNLFSSQLLEPLSVIQLQSATQATAYPNVFISVGELQIPSASTVIADVGGIFPFAFGILGLLMIFWNLRIKKAKGKEAKGKGKPPKKDRKPRRGRKSRKEEPKDTKSEQKEFGGIIPPEKRSNYLYYAILFSVWLLITAYAFTKGVRFVEAFSLPIALCAGIFVGFIANYLKTQIEKPLYQYVAMALVIVLVCYGPVSSANAVSNSVVPGTDDAMVNTLTWVKNNTPSNAVMTSWWDFGHLFAVKADRGVTFDGGSQNNARAYWVGKALSTNNEALSAGILKMLASSGDNGYMAVENFTNNTGKTVEIMDKILVTDKTSAQNTLTSQYGMTTEQAQNVLQYTHPTNTTPDLFVTSLDMVGKAGWWSYFGNWNFDSKNSTNSIYSLAQANATTENNVVTIQGENNVTVQINGTNVTGGLQVSKNKIAPPHRLIIVSNGTTAMDTVVNNQSTFSILVVKQDDNLITVAMSKELEDSMFTRLFFMQGAGLTHFKLAHKEPSEGISEVMVWNVT
ncbi:STT3 domain-containing protein [Methanobacterium sp.]|uniref:STT3 domain-containing protein n=1 Tax=Methanobacterium sp. TaxID=2164 RepID=UPI002AB90476|nr:STT3 domain-containing protein [Methanobacterium sp.]MDY9922478.1 STT3 domain-containing protein [Methanobacterium sp.]